MDPLAPLVYVGEALSKPGRAVRGLLGGRPEEMLAAVPFSDSLGLTNPANQVTGRELLDQLGLTARGADDFGSSLAGFGLDVATDPLTFAGGAIANRLLGGAFRRGAGGAAAGAAGDTFALDPYAALRSPDDVAADAMRGATSPWAPPSQLDLPPLATAEGLSLGGVPKTIPLRPELPPIDELWSPEGMGWFASYGPDYEGLAAKRGWQNWGSSVPTEMAEDGLRAQALRLNLDKWDDTLSDLDRLTPGARQRLGLVDDPDAFELQLADDIAQNSDLANQWQDLLGLRFQELRSLAALADRGILPAGLAERLTAQQARVAPFMDRWLPPAGIATTIDNVVEHGTVRPGDVGRLTARIVDQELPGSGMLAHLPVDDAALLAAAERSQYDNGLTALADRLERYGNQYGFDPNEIATLSARDQVSAIGKIFNPEGYGAIDPAIVSRILDDPVQYGGEYAALIQQAQELMPQLQARVAGMEQARGPLLDLLRQVAGRVENLGPDGMRGGHSLDSALRSLGYDDIGAFGRQFGVTNADLLAMRYELPEDRLAQYLERLAWNRRF